MIRWLIILALIYTSPTWTRVVDRTIAMTFDKAEQTKVEAARLRGAL